jgi:hypothetical protein
MVEPHVIKWDGWLVLCVDEGVFMGSIEASVRYVSHGIFVCPCCSSRVVVRYDSLELMANVTVRYQPNEGTFKMSGSYGAPRHIKD